MLFSRFIVDFFLLLCTETLEYFFKYHLLCSTEDKNSYRTETTRGWANDDRAFIFGWTVSLSRFHLFRVNALFCFICAYFAFFISLHLSLHHSLSSLSLLSHLIFSLSLSLSLSLISLSLCSLSPSLHLSSLSPLYLLSLSVSHLSLSLCLSLSLSSLSLSLCLSISLSLSPSLSPSLSLSLCLSLSINSIQFRKLYWHDKTYILYCQSIKTT